MRAFISGCATREGEGEKSIPVCCRCCFGSSCMHACTVMNRLLAASTRRNRQSLPSHSALFHSSAATSSTIKKHSTPKSSSASMRPSSLYHLCLSTTLLFSTGTHGLPFRGRVVGKEDSASKEEEAVVDGGDVTIQVRHPARSAGGNRRNSVVDFFYDDPDSFSLELKHEIKNRTSEIVDFLVETRRTLHRNPELMYQEEATSQTIQSLLTEMGIAHSTGWAKNIHPHAFKGPGGYGIVADIGTGQAPCILLRADMDALPIHERTEHVDDFRSQTDNVFHACAHDGHSTMLLGAARILKEMEDSLEGTVRLVFQPAEEGGAGGKRMREEGMLEKHPPPSYGFGMHMWPTLPSGTVAARPGALMAACERFEVLVHGVGGHAAMPHQTVDPIVTASAIVMNLQTIVSRTVSPLDSGVCSITQFDAGSGAFNVIPNAATLKGTIRALSTETLLELRDRVEHIVHMTAKTHGCNATIEYSPDLYPVTANDPWLFETFSREVGALVSEEGVLHHVDPTMGAEDFSFVAETIPSTFFFLGQGSGTEPATNYGLHHPHFALDESVLPRGVELHVNLAVRALAKLANDGEEVLKSKA